MRLVFRRAAEKTLDRIPADCRRQILSRIKDVAADPSSRDVSVKPLAGNDSLRLRVNNYRVVFSLDEAAGVLTIELIGTRGDIYKR